MLLFLQLSIFQSIPPIFAQNAEHPKQGAEVLKTDILGVFAHPDDETGAAATLAAYARGSHAIVANVYCTRGEGGGNMVGTQAGPALGILREAELRNCLAQLGVRYCYFLDRLDWAYTESLSATFENWGREASLERLVRLVRALRPEIILTMNPAPTPGQHGHHQAAGVLATEAFSAAADPTCFPEQLHKEGLGVWQPRKLYFIGKSGDVTCTIRVNQPMSDGQTPGQVAARALSSHRSQAFGNFSDSPWVRRPQVFTLIKSFVVPEPGETNLLQGLPVSDSDLKSVELARPQPLKPLEVSFVPRPALNRYRLWVREQNIAHAAEQFRTDLPLVAGEPNEVQVGVENNGPESLQTELKLDLPSGWKAEPDHQTLDLAKDAKAIPRFMLTPPLNARGDADLVVHLSDKSQGELGRASVTAHLLPSAQVMRVNESPSVDDTDRGWSNAPEMQITPKDLVEGRVKDEADSSASFRIVHDGQTLFLDVRVKDDVVVTNIAPNDIKGHWRSDSIEICVDPVGGAEHTFGCYKLGIFPFVTSGVVRGERDADAHQGLIEETAPGTRLYSFRTADGYRVKVAIPFSELGLNFPQRREFGFNLIIYDGDKSNAAIGENINKSRIAWSPRPGVQGRPEDWGRLTLK
jgi:LmbE family N-acetylglucosaminyl deacetylase